jgi:hypothetical protein
MLSFYRLEWRVCTRILNIGDDLAPVKFRLAGIRLDYGFDRSRRIGFLHKNRSDAGTAKHNVVFHPRHGEFVLDPTRGKLCRGFR